MFMQILRECCAGMSFWTLSLISLKRSMSVTSCHGLNILYGNTFTIIYMFRCFIALTMFWYWCKMYHPDMTYKVHWALKTNNQLSLFTSRFCCCFKLQLCFCHCFSCSSISHFYHCCRLYSDFLFFYRQKNKTKESFHILAQKQISVFVNCLKDKPLRNCAYSKQTQKVRKPSYVDRLGIQTSERYQNKIFRMLCAFVKKYLC